MISQLDLAAYLQRLRRKTAEDYGILKDTLILISDAVMAPSGEESNAMQIAATLIEIAYPETLGELLWLSCRYFNKTLEEDKDKSLGTCVDCRIKEIL